MQPDNPYAAPKADVLDVGVLASSADLTSLPVSESWRRKFALLEKAGGVRMPAFKSLSVGERMRVSFNFLAFLFGPIYYLCKGMWRKAISFFLACVAALSLLSWLLEAAGLPELDRALGYGVAAVFAVRANIDYYKKMVLGDNGWW